MSRRRPFLVLLLLALCPAAARADEDAAPGARYLEQALAQAGANRAQLEQVLAHYEEPGAVQELEAARFLIANMPGKGYIVTELRDGKGNAVPFDPLSYTDFREARAAIEALEKEHGELEFDRTRKIDDLHTVTAAFLVRHIEEAFAAWRGTPEKLRVSFDTFLHYVLPYRGSQEPIDDWIVPLRRRYAAKARALGTKMDVAQLYEWVSQDVHRHVRFDERYYLHPTDQSFTEMGRSGLGRCEDITNMTTYAARSLAIATAADYTPYWAQRDNNHAWNVLLDAQGRGSAPANAHAAKVYRKTYAIQRDCLAFQLPEGREAPNRFLQSTSYVDVTDQYAPTTDVVVEADAQRVGEERLAYLCVFNGGEWKAIQWARLEDGQATFERMGRNILYLPAVHDGEKLVPIAVPLIVEKDGTVRRTGGDARTGLWATAVAPRKVSPDTSEVTPTSHLRDGGIYVLYRWTGEWEMVRGFTARTEPERFESLRSRALYWLVEEASRRLERPFTIENGRQRFW